MKNPILILVLAAVAFILFFKKDKPQSAQPDENKTGDFFSSDGGVYDGSMLGDYSAPVITAPTTTTESTATASSTDSSTSTTTSSDPAPPPGGVLALFTFRQTKNPFL